MPAPYASKIPLKISQKGPNERVDYYQGLQTDFYPKDGKYKYELFCRWDGEAIQVSNRQKSC